MSIDTGGQLQLTEFAGQVGEQGGKDVHGNTIPEEELIADLQAGYIALGHAPSQTDMDTYGEHGAKTYHRRFGSWINALEAADIPVPEERRKDDE